MISGTWLPTGATVIADMDFETYSEAGFVWDGTGYKTLPGARTKGISAVGAVVYTEHPSARVLCLAYDLKDGMGRRLWIPGTPDPIDLFRHIVAGRLIEAWNCNFEFYVWQNICVPQHNWPPLPYQLMRDAMAKSQAHAWPGALAKAAIVSRTTNQKMKEGKRLLNKFSVPRKPTKKDPRRRILPTEDLTDGQLLYDYCLQDIKTEADISEKCPDLDAFETEFELCTRKMNIRGVQLDMETIHAACKLLQDALEKYDTEIRVLTNGAVPNASKVQKLMQWLNEAHGLGITSLRKEELKELLTRPFRPDVLRVLQIRSIAGSAGVKKVYAMQRMADKNGCAHDLFVYHGARTGRDTGRDLQPQNLVKAGPNVCICAGCSRSYGAGLLGNACPYCHYPNNTDTSPWSWEYVEDAVQVIRTGELSTVERFYSNPLLALSGCIRGLFTAREGHNFICSDYSSIEAVVIAALAGEQWRLEAFKKKEDIYLHSASRTTGIPFDDYVAYAQANGKKHPDRGKIGKPQELGLGFGGWIAAWYQFDKSGTYTEEQVKQNIIAWRAASPAIVEFWGGQVRGKPWAPDCAEYYGLEGAAIQAVANPGQRYHVGYVSFVVTNDTLFCRLPSGRNLTYHNPMLKHSDRWPGQLQLCFYGWNSDPTKGPYGWIEIRTYGGRLAENVTQAIARDIMAHAVILAERAGYNIVLRVHDEIVAEVPEGAGSIEELEAIMGTLPPWAADWPVRAAGGWTGKRYRKD